MKGPTAASAHLTASVGSEWPVRTMTVFWQHTHTHTHTQKERKTQTNKNGIFKPGRLKIKAKGK